MTESAVDRELQALLAVEPSREFVPRVRTRIAEEPQPSAWWQSWKLVTAVALAAAVVLAVVLMRPREAARSQPVERREASTDITRPTPSAAARAQEPSVAQEQYVASPFRRTGPEGPAEAGRHVQTEGPAGAGHHLQLANADAAVTAIEPEILIDARESSALRALIRGARDGRVDLEAMLRAATPNAMDLPPVGAIDIPIITIDPITPGTGEEGVRQ